MWNLKNNVKNKQNENGLIDTENRLMEATGEERWRAG